MFETDRSATKSERTRAKISSAAITSFLEHGYADTTMRSIAEAAGVSVGNAYYYFPSKNHLVQDLYERVQQDHASVARPLLATERTLTGRLRVVFETGLSTLGPYHRIAPGFLTAMVSPDSPLHPLSVESSAARSMTVALFREAVEGADRGLPDDIAPLLPDALFTLYLALVQRWTYDGSPGQERTARLLNAGLRMLGLAVPFLRVPVLSRAARELLDLVAEVRS